MGEPFIDLDIITGVRSGSGTRMTVASATTAEGNKILVCRIKAADGRAISMHLSPTPARYILNALAEGVRRITNEPRSTSSPPSPELGSAEH